MKKKFLNKRQDKILEILEKRGELAIFEILREIEVLETVSKITVNRDLKKLLKLNYIITKGKARAVTYELSQQYNLIRPVNIDEYFKIEADKRKAKKNFDFDIFSYFKNDILFNEEKSHVEILNNEYRENIKKISAIIKKKEFERLIIELSWKSSRIEGNTYTLLETEALIKEGREAKGHKKEEAIMILNHKKALNYIVKNRDSFKKVNTRNIEDVHYLLTKDLGISRNLRKIAVGITGTEYAPLDNQHQIQEAMGKMCDIANGMRIPFSKAIILSVLIAYIQPFEDGNKRTSRLMANAILLAYNMCPLSYKKVDEAEYKKAAILFYEQNNLSYFKELFIEQFEFAVKNYFKV